LGCDARMSPFAGFSLANQDGRERKNPSMFWLVLLLSSVGLHVGSLLLVPALWRSRQTQAPASNPLPIEVVELAEQPGDGAVAPPTAPEGATAEAIAPSAPVAPVAPPTPDAQPQPSQPEASTTRPPDPVRRFPFPSAQPAPAPIPTPAPAPSPQPPPDPAPQPTNEVFPPQNPAPQPPAPADPPPQPVVGTPLPEPVAPPPTAPPDPLSPGNPPLPDSAINPGVPDPRTGTLPGAGGDSGDQSSDIMGNGESLEAIGVPGEAPPREVTADLVEVSPLPPEQLQDIPDTHPEPLARSQTATADPFDQRYCQIFPGSVTPPGQPVTLRLIIGEDGNVQEAIVRSSSGNPAYDDLASCILENYWTFQPATVEGIPTSSDSLEVTITLR